MPGLLKTAVSDRRNLDALRRGEKSAGKSVFSLMTSFTPCYEDILYTRARVEREGAGHNRPSKGNQDGMENGGRSGTAGAFCECVPCRREEFPAVVPGVRHLSADRLSVAASLPKAGGMAAIVEKSRRPPAQPEANPTGDRAAGRGAAPPAARLGARKLQVLLQQQESICRSSPCIAFCCGTIW